MLPKLALGLGKRVANRKHGFESRATMSLYCEAAEYRAERLTPKLLWMSRSSGSTPGRPCPRRRSAKRRLASRCFHDQSGPVSGRGLPCMAQWCVARSILGAGMRDPIGFMEPGKKHSQVHLDGPGLCPLCLERDIDGREGGAK